jgi:hypothetical protein
MFNFVRTGGGEIVFTVDDVDRDDCKASSVEPLKPVFRSLFPCVAVKIAKIFLGGLFSLLVYSDEIDVDWKIVVERDWLSDWLLLVKSTMAELGPDIDWNGILFYF